MLVQYLSWEDPLEEEMATHSRILAWKVPWAEEPVKLLSIGLQRVGSNLATESMLIREQLTRGILTEVTGLWGWRRQYLGYQTRQVPTACLLLTQSSLLFFHR